MIISRRWRRKWRAALGTLVADLDLALQATGGVVDQVDFMDLTRPTPCSDWSLRELLNHVVAVSESQQLRFGAAEPSSDGPRGPAPSRLASRVLGDRGRGDAAASSKPGLFWAHLLSAYRTFRRDVALGIDFFDILIHGWDLATTVGAAFAMDEKATDAAFAVARLIVTAESQAQGQ